jgi:hypothetical protein
LDGGLGVAKDVFIQGSLTVNGTSIMIGISTVTNTTQSTSSTTGALITSGGLGIAKDTFIGGSLNIDGLLNSNSTTESTSILTGSIIIDGGVGIAKNVYTSGLIVQTNTTQSSSSTTGSVQIAGGLGLAKDLFIGGSLTTTGTSTLNGAVNILDTTESTLPSTGSLVLSGGFGVAKETYLGGILDVFGTVNVQDTTASTSPTTGSIKFAGGVGISKSLNVGGELNVFGDSIIYGDFTVMGTKFTSNTTTLSTKDNIIVVNSAPSGTSDSGISEKRYQLANDTSLGDVITSDIDYSSTSQSTGTSTTIVLSAGSSIIDDFYNKFWIHIISGTGSGQVRKIKSYNATSKTATIYDSADETSNPQTPIEGLDFSTIPDETSNYNLFSTQYIIQIWDETQKVFLIGSTRYDSSVDTYINTDNYKIKTSTGSLILNNTQDSTNITTGSLVTVGGAGIAKNLYIGENLNVIGTSNFTGVASFTNTTQSSSPGTGSLITLGGLGVTKDTYFGGNINVVETSTLVGAVGVTNTTQSTSISTGAFIVDGGVGIEKDVFIGGSTTLQNGLDVNSNKIVNCLDPTSDLDVANKKYVDESIIGTRFVTSNSIFDIEDEGVLTTVQDMSITPTSAGTYKVTSNIEFNTTLRNITAQAALDLTAFVSTLASQSTTSILFPAFVAGTTINPGVYAQAAAATATGTITFDGLNNENSIFIFRTNGAFSSAASCVFNLINDAKPGNIFFLSGGAISLGASSTLSGTFTSSIGAVGLGAGSILAGRLLTKDGAISIAGNVTYPSLYIPFEMGVLFKFAAFTSIKNLTNTGSNTITGDIGVNDGNIVGITSATVNGEIYLAGSSNSVMTGSVCIDGVRQDISERSREDVDSKNILIFNHIVTITANQEISICVENLIGISHFYNRIIMVEKINVI